MFFFLFAYIVPGSLLILGMCLQSRWASNQSGLQVDLGRPFLPDRPVFSLLHLAKWPESFKAAIWGRDVMSSSPVVQCRVCGRRCEGQKCLLTFINYKWVCGETQTTISAASLRRQDTHTHTHCQLTSASAGPVMTENIVTQAKLGKAHDSAAGQQIVQRWNNVCHMGLLDAQKHREFSTNSHVLRCTSVEMSYSEFKYHRQICVKFLTNIGGHVLEISAYSIYKTTLVDVFIKSFVCV